MTHGLLDTTDNTVGELLQIASRCAGPLYDLVPNEDLELYADAFVLRAVLEELQDRLSPDGKTLLEPAERSA